MVLDKIQNNPNEKIKSRIKKTSVVYLTWQTFMVQKKRFRKSHFDPVNNPYKFHYSFSISRTYNFVET